MSGMVGPHKREWWVHMVKNLQHNGAWKFVGDTNDGGK